MGTGSCLFLMDGLVFSRPGGSPCHRLSGNRAGQTDTTSIWLTSEPFSLAVWRLGAVGALNLGYSRSGRLARCGSVPTGTNCMKRNKELSQEDWERLLRWLDPDPQRAEVRYLDLHRRLTHFFVNRGAANAEELADQTFNQATATLKKLQETYVGDPAPYLFKIAQRLWSKSNQERQKHTEVAAAETQSWLHAPDPAQLEREAECLEKCLSALPPKQRDLILRYYRVDKHSKIEQHKLLAEELGISAGALRLRALRIRNELELCLEKRLKADV